VLKRCEANGVVGERWKEMVAKTALEMVGKLHELDLDPEYKILKMKYFGGDGKGPSTLSWKPGSAFADEASNAGAPAPATTSSSSSSLPIASEAAGPPKAQKPAQPAKPKNRTPKHSIIHRAVGDLASSWGDSALVVSGRPRELLVKVRRMQCMFAMAVLPLMQGLQ